MFETSVVRARAVAPRRRIALLAASFILHTLAAAAVVFAGVASVRFPPDAPPEVEAYSPVIPVVLPPPLGPRTSPSPPKQTQAPLSPEPPAATLPSAPLAPLVIPDSVPSADPSPGLPAESTPTAGGNGEPRAGSPYGVPGGTGDPSAIGTGAGESSGPLQPGGEVRPAVVLARVHPEYPRLAVQNRIGGYVKIRCVIDKEGRIRDPGVVASSFGGFEQPALTAIRMWRFAPGSYRGRPIDTWFELTVTFAVK